jgi:guanylate kinase
LAGFDLGRSCIVADLYIVSAPSGAGKTSLVRALLESRTGIEASVSYTTRPPRPGEVNGRDYRFVSQARFAAMLERNELLEHAGVFGHAYGTPERQVRERLDSGVDVVLVIDWQGARQVRQAWPTAVSVFILPPSLQALEERLRGRGQDDEAVIAHRLARARAEIEHWPEYDYLVVNEDFSSALEDLQSIVRCRRLRREPQRRRLKPLLAELE